MKLTTEAKYALYSAVRGPDTVSDDSTYLKREVTARIRAIVFEKKCRIPGIIVRKKLTKRQLPQIAAVARRMTATQQHYIDHLAYAIKWSCHHRIWGGLAVPLVEALTEP